MFNFKKDSEIMPNDKPTSTDNQTTINNPNKIQSDNLEAKNPAKAPILKEVNPNSCRRWKYHNRNESWLNRPEQETLKNSIDRDGQLEFGLVRIIENDPTFSYEIIYGYRRSEACKSLAINFKVRVLPANTPDSVCMQYMHVENKESRDVSELEDAVVYQRLLKDGVYSNQTDLADSLCITQGYISRLLSTAKVFEYPWIKELIDPIIMNVSVNSANKISTGLKDTQMHRAMKYAAENLKNKEDIKTGSDLVNALINIEKRERKGVKKKVLVKKGRTNMVEIQNNAAGKVVLTIDPFERTEEETINLLSQINKELKELL